MNLEGTVTGPTPMKEGAVGQVPPCPTPTTCPTCQPINAPTVTHIDTMGQEEPSITRAIRAIIMGVGPHSVKHWIPFMPSLLPNP